MFSLKVVVSSNKTCVGLKTLMLAGNGTIDFKDAMLYLPFVAGQYT